MSRLRKTKVEEKQEIVEIEPKEAHLDMPEPIIIKDNRERINNIQNKYKSLGEFIYIKEDVQEQELNELEMKADMRMSRSIDNGMTTMLLKSYAKICSPVCDEEALLNSLLNDEILKNSMTQALSYYLASFNPFTKLGVLMAGHTAGNFSLEKIRSIKNNVKKSTETAVQVDNQGEIWAGEDHIADEPAGLEKYV